MVMGWVRLQMSQSAEGVMNGSFWRRNSESPLFLSMTRPWRISIWSPPVATTRLMKLVSDRCSVGRGQGENSEWFAPQTSSSAPLGGLNTTTSPRPGLLKRRLIRSTSTRWPTARVGTIDSLGMRKGLTRNAWIPSARPRATTTIVTSSTRELRPPFLPPAVFALATTLRGSLVVRRALVSGRRLGLVGFRGGLLLGRRGNVLCGLLLARGLLSGSFGSGSFGSGRLLAGGRFPGRGFGGSSLAGLGGLLLGLHLGGQLLLAGPGGLLVR